MNHPLRRSSLLVLWLLLALLPLRGWAHVAMHLPDTQTPAMAPCHGVEAATDASGAPLPCTLSDVCHGAMLVGPAPQGEDRRAQPLPAAAPRPAAATQADGLVRPPGR